MLSAVSPADVSDGADLHLCLYLHSPVPPFPVSLFVFLPLTLTVSYLHVWTEVILNVCVCWSGENSDDTDDDPANVARHLGRVRTDDREPEREDAAASIFILVALTILLCIILSHMRKA